MYTIIGSPIHYESETINIRFCLFVAIKPVDSVIQTNNSKNITLCDNSFIRCIGGARTVLNTRVQENGTYNIQRICISQCHPSNGSNFVCYLCGGSMFGLAHMTLYDSAVHTYCFVFRQLHDAAVHDVNFTKCTAAVSDATLVIGKYITGDVDVAHTSITNSSTPSYNVAVNVFSTFDTCNFVRNVATNGQTFYTQFGSHFKSCVFSHNSPMSFAPEPPSFENSFFDTPPTNVNISGWQLFDTVSLNDLAHFQHDLCIDYTMNQYRRNSILKSFFVSAFLLLRVY